MRGSGKSTLTRKLATMPEYDRKIVFDINGEWKGSHHVFSFEEFSNVWRKIFNEDKFTIVIGIPYGQSQEEIQALASQVSSLVYRTGKESELYTCLIFEEAQFYFPTYNLSPELFSLLTVGRHGYLNIIANTQRPAQIHKTLISQSADVYIGKLFEMNDIKYLMGTIGDTALDAKNLQSGEFIHYKIGEGATEIICVF